MSEPIDSFKVTRPDVLLRLEAVALLLASGVGYARIYPGHWWLFMLLFLVPDISLAGYFVSNGRVPAALYNVAHSYVLPLVVGALAWQRGWALGGEMAVIWLSHISFDRALGYGLKFAGDFKHTHLQSSAVRLGSRWPFAVEPGCS